MGPLSPVNKLWQTLLVDGDWPWPSRALDIDKTNYILECMLHLNNSNQTFSH